MLFKVLLCNMLFIPLIYSSNATSTKTILPTKTQPIESHVEEKLHSPAATKIQVLTEGGPQLDETPVLTIAKDEHSLPANVDNEMGNKNVIEQHVKGRKGANFSDITLLKVDKNVSQAEDHTSSDKNIVTPVKIIPDLKDSNMNITTIKPATTNAEVSAKINSTTAKPEHSTLPHKPTKVSYDELEKASLKTSPETAVSQLPSPNRKVKLPGNVNSHPGMVMPIVITILLVPMFAVLGYMAFRRGQEAWKNRHYKRMDFLLDGMYND